MGELWSSLGCWGFFGQPRGDGGAVGPPGCCRHMVCSGVIVRSDGEGSALREPSAVPGHPARVRPPSCRTAPRCSLPPRVVTSPKGTLVGRVGGLRCGCRTGGAAKRAVGTARWHGVWAELVVPFLWGRGRGAEHPAPAIPILLHCWWHRRGRADVSPQWLRERIPNRSGVLAAPALPLRRKLSVLSAFPLTLGFGAYHCTQLRGKRACGDKSSCSGRRCSGLCSSHIPHDLSVWLGGRLRSAVSVSHPNHRPAAAPRMAPLCPCLGKCQCQKQCFSIRGVGTGSSCPLERCLEQSAGEQGVPGGTWAQPALPGPVLHALTPPAATKPPRSSCRDTESGRSLKRCHGAGGCGDEGTRLALCGQTQQVTAEA